MTRKEFVALAKTKGFKRDAIVSDGESEWLERITHIGVDSIFIFKDNTVSIEMWYNLDDITPEFLEAVLSKKGVGK